MVRGILAFPSLFFSRRESSPLEERDLIEYDSYLPNAGVCVFLFFSFFVQHTRRRFVLLAHDARKKRDFAGFCCEVDFVFAITTHTKERERERERERNISNAFGGLCF